MAIRAKAKQKKAELEAKAAAAETRRAAQDSAAAVRDLALALTEQVKSLGIDERAGELAARVRDSEAVGRAAAKKDELGARLRESESYRTTRDNATRATASGLTALGGWLSSGQRAERLGVRPVKGKKRGRLLWLLLGAAAGYAGGLFTGTKRDDDLTSQFSGGPGYTGGLETASPSAVPTEQATTEQGTTEQGTSDAAAPAAQKPLAEEVRSRLGQDPRTADLPKLNINVAENTVFVRGAVPGDFDQDTIRKVITTVPGVEDVDLQLTTT